MNPTYRFRMVVGSNTRTVYPVWGNNLAISYERASDDQYFRQKLVGNLTFLRSDYDYILTAAFDTQFKLYIDISRNAGVSWSQYWAGQFYKTDCTFNAASRTVVVTPQTLDAYNDVLAGLEKEYNIVDMPVEMMRVQITKRAMIQIYVPGDSVISCFLSGMNWEQEIDPISNEADLQGMYHFGRISGSESIVVSGATNPSDINGNYTSMGNMAGYAVISRMEERPFPDDPDYTTFFYVQEVVKDGVVYWTWESQTGYNYDDVTYTPVSGVAEGDLRIVRTSTSVYGRWVFDNPNPQNRTAYPILSNDPVYNNRNYRFVYPYNPLETVIYYGTQFTSTPNKYGIYQPGQYYVPPTVGYGTPIPVARSTWGAQSIWYRPTQSTDWNTERTLWNKYIMGNAYPIQAVISALLGQVAPNISHAGTVAYSQFLYGTNPLGGPDYHLFITPKSNILKGNYSEPAQRAVLTLKQVLDMLRDCFRCYWWIDSNNRFRIEHISYFMRGGSYSDNPTVGRDLTIELVPRSGKPWATGQDAYTFDKIEMPERYQFAWMDPVTQIFEGGALDIISGFVEKGKINDIRVSNFTSDVDYMLLNPAGCSSEGFALMSFVPMDVNMTGGAITDIDNGLTVTFNPDAFAYAGCSVQFVARELSRSLTVNVVFYKDGVAVLTTTVDFPLNATYNETFNTPAGIDTMVVSYNSGGSGEVGVNSILPSSVNGIAELPFVGYLYDGNVIRCQNGYLSFRALQDNYMYDMPAPNVQRNGVTLTVHGTKRLKANTVNFPSIADPNLYELIKTNIGNGQISKISVTLSSRNANAELKYDTQ